MTPSAVPGTGPGWATYLIRYGEIGIKGPSVRRRFEDRLVKNVQAHFARAKATCTVERGYGRTFVDSPDHEVARHAITHTFGIVSGSPCRVVDADMATMERACAELAPHVVEPGQSFAIRARRTGEHEFGSMDVGRACGSAVYKAVPGLTVDLDEPDVEVHVEVRYKSAYIFHEVLDGPGGLPAGTQGKVVVPALGVRSAPAAWLAMRRGAGAHLLVPEGCLAGVAALGAWCPGLEATVLPVRPSREGLLAAAIQLAEWRGAHAIVLDEHETSIAATGQLGFPTLRPLAGLPGKRWPAGAREMGKAAADHMPGPYVHEDGEGPEACISALKGAERVAL